MVALEGRRRQRPAGRGGCFAWRSEGSDERERPLTWLLHVASFVHVIGQLRSKLATSAQYRPK